MLRITYISRFSKITLLTELQINRQMFSVIKSSNRKYSPIRTGYHSLHFTLKPYNSYLSANMVRDFASMNEKDKTNTSTKVEHVVPEASTTIKVNQRTKLKQAIRDYGATIIVFHVTISLASLGLCYLAISNGMDAVSVLAFLGFSESVISSKVAVGGSTFVIAYAVHKVFAPVRIGITLTVAPFIVRYLRRINLLKPPKK